MSVDSFKRIVVETQSDIKELRELISSKNLEIGKIIQETNILKKEANNERKRVETLELQIEKAKDDIIICETRLEENLLAIDESRRAHDNLERKCQAQENLIKELEEKMLDVQLAVKVSNNNYFDVANRLKEVEEKIEKSESSMEVKEKTIKELQFLHNVYNNNAQIAEPLLLNNQKLMHDLSIQIQEITTKLQEANDRARRAEEDASVYLTDITTLEDEIVLWREKNSALYLEMEQINENLAS